MKNEDLLTDMDILLNDMIFSEVMNAGPRDTDIDIYNRLVQYYTVHDLDHCVKVLKLIHINMNIKKRLSDS